MNTRRRWIPIIILLATQLGPCQEPGRKYALLIGVGSYQSPGVIPALHFTDADLLDLKKLLTLENYEVTPVSNEQAFRTNIIRELYKFAVKVKEQDTFLIYFSGHGVKNLRINQSPYWVTYRTSLDVLDDEGIRLSHLLDYIRDIKAKRKIVLLDHCFSGNVVDTLMGAADVTTVASLGEAAVPPGPPGSGSRTTGMNLVLNRNAFPDQDFSSFSGRLGDGDVGLVVLTAARNEAFELDNIGHGVFTKAILDACSANGADIDKNGVVSMGELMDFVGQDVGRLASSVSREQKVLQYHVGTGLKDWIFCNVSAAQAQDVVNEVKSYSTKIAQWKLKDLIDASVETRCISALINWKQSRLDNTPLSTEDQQVVNSVATAIKGSEPENVRAARLNAEVMAILNGR